jgi:hypothetical protein
MTSSEIELASNSESFGNWTKGRDIPALGTNAGAAPIAFQGWQHFKEAFAPELIARAVAESPNPVLRCADLFGGSGTTPLACQFLGIEPIVAEINPYLADVIESKLTIYDFDTLATDARRVVEGAGKLPSLARLQDWMMSAPPTLFERAGQPRWIFDRNVAKQIFALVSAISRLKDEKNRRFFRVILGGQLIELSNVRINGKGRRYRSNWKERTITQKDVLNRFCDAVTAAASDLAAHQDRRYWGYTIVRDDSRKIASMLPPLDLVVFSPPYPNSFDYTDVYNVELWTLGYLRNAKDNRRLRNATLASHVQIKRAYPGAPTGSILLDQTLAALGKRQKNLWSKDIPAMIGGYFADLVRILRSLRSKLSAGARIYLVVGDSRYAGVTIPVASILVQLAEANGYALVYADAFRSMRTSAQQGGKLTLPETLVVLH